MKININFLRRVPLFEDLSEEELISVAGLFKERRYTRNGIVFVEEDTGKYMYIIKEGRVKVSRLLASGKETILAFHEEGEFFGEMALIDAGTTPATVTAVVASNILVVGAQDFNKLINHPKVNRALLKMLCRRCRDAWAQIETLTFYHADARIRKTLYQFCQKRGIQTDRGAMIGLHLTHQELACVAGVTRETATRVIGHLQNENLLRVETRHFLIADPAGLVDDLSLQ